MALHRDVRRHTEKPASFGDTRASGAGCGVVRRCARFAARLADYKVPETISWTDAPLPRNTNGKLMKRLLRERLPA